MNRIGVAVVTRILSAAALGAIAIGMLASQAGAAPAREGVLAYRILHAPAGGVLRARDGAQLLVPRGALRHDALVTITELRGGRFDFNIAGEWTGQVRVTLPRHRRASFVMHDIAGSWVPEGQRGARTAWVSQLSVFSWLGDLGDKVKSTLCLTRDPLKFVRCLVGKGLSKIDSTLVKWVAGLAGVSNQCAQDLIASKGFVGSMLTILLSSDCRGHAGETPVPGTVPGTSPGGPTGTQPVSPPTGSGAPPSTGTPPVESPAPPPPPSQSIEIGWSASHSGWIWMSLTGFPPGSYAYSCDFASGGDATFVLTETASPETWDNGHTCFDFEAGDRVWVTIGGVSSNTIGVP